MEVEEQELEQVERKEQEQGPHLEWTATGFLITRPSLISFLMFCLELALAISLISLGSNHTWDRGQGREDAEVEGKAEL